MVSNPQANPDLESELETERRQPPSVSIAVPVFNEEEIIPELLRRTTAVLDQLPEGEHEIVIVDDGSTDNTACLLRQGAARDPRIIVVELSRNFGHQAALTAALEQVRGDVTLVMDGDLQDSPEALPFFLAEYERGFDVVYCRRSTRPEGILLRASYFLFYRLIAAISDTRLPIDSGDFALLSRQVVEAIRTLPEHHRYLRGIRTWVGFRQASLTLERSSRAAGESKYGLGKLLRLAFDGIFAFSVVPLRLTMLVGLIAMLASSIYTLWALFARFFLAESPAGFTALIVAIVFLAGVQLLFLGVVGEYVGRIYQEVKKRPHYVVRQITGR